MQIKTKLSTVDFKKVPIMSFKKFKGNYDENLQRKGSNLNQN